MDSQNAANSKKKKIIESVGLGLFGLGFFLRGVFEVYISYCTSLHLWLYIFSVTVTTCHIHAKKTAKYKSVNFSTT